MPRNEYRAWAVGHWWSNKGTPSSNERDWFIEIGWSNWRLVFSSIAHWRAVHFVSRLCWLPKRPVELIRCAFAFTTFHINQVRLRVQVLLFHSCTAWEHGLDVDRRGFFREEPLSKMNDSTPVTINAPHLCDWSRVIHFAERLLLKKSMTVHTTCWTTHLAQASAMEFLTPSHHFEGPMVSHVPFIRKSSSCKFIFFHNSFSAVASSSGSHSVQDRHRHAATAKGQEAKSPKLAFLGDKGPLLCSPKHEPFTSSGLQILPRPRSGSHCNQCEEIWEAPLGNVTNSDHSCLFHHGIFFWAPKSARWSVPHEVSVTRRT